MWVELFSLGFYSLLATGTTATLLKDNVSPGRTLESLIVLLIATLGAVWTIPDWEALLKLLAVLVAYYFLLRRYPLTPFMASVAFLQVVLAFLLTLTKVSVFA